MYAKEFQSIVERRRSNRKFDPEVNVPEDVVRRSLERTLLSPNSSNMQLWEFYWIHTEEEKKKMIPLCLSQSAAKTAKEFVVFVTRRDLWRERARWNRDRIREAYEQQPPVLQKKGMLYYGKVMPLLYARDILGVLAFFRRCTSFFGGLFKPFMRFGGKADQRVIVHKSCALAAQTFMLSIAAEGFDTCPMEGIDAYRLRKYLRLPYGAEINMVIAIGKGTARGIWGPRFRVPYEEVVFVR
ncbi:MAG: hypothetical protein RL732_422 [Bacteroidota bacterium]